MSDLLAVHVSRRSGYPVHLGPRTAGGDALQVLWDDAVELLCLYEDGLRRLHLAAGEEITLRFKPYGQRCGSWRIEAESRQAEPESNSALLWRCCRCGGLLWEVNVESSEPAIGPDWCVACIAGETKTPLTR